MVLPQTSYLICQPILSALPSESLLATLNTTTWSNHNFLSPQLFATGSQWSCSLLQSLLNTAPSDAINKSDTSVLGSEAPHGSTIQIQNPTHVDGLQSLRTWTLTTFWLHLPLSLLHTSLTELLSFLKKSPATGPLHFLFPLPIRLFPQQKCGLLLCSIQVSALMSVSDHLSFIFLHSHELNILHSIICSCLLSIYPDWDTRYMLSISKKSKLHESKGLVPPCSLLPPQNLPSK